LAGIELEFFRTLLSRYLGHDGETFGQEYMRCPSQEEDCLRTYGVNYGNVVYYDGVRDIDFGNYEQYPGIRYDNIGTHQFIFADAHMRGWRYAGHDPYWGGIIYTNFGYGWDWDGDGLNDTYGTTEEGVGGAGPYNGFGPWHLGRSGNMAFSDGHVETITIEQYLTNDSNTGLWNQSPFTGR
jgi:prepilin-type processing-associated H-X9-DG protein